MRRLFLIEFPPVSLLFPNYSTSLSLSGEICESVRIEFYYDIPFDFAALLRLVVEGTVEASLQFVTALHRFYIYTRRDWSEPVIYKVHLRYFILGMPFVRYTFRVLC